MTYCVNPFITKRRKTHVVTVGSIGIGGDNPIRVQSMTNTDTLNTEATVRQAEELYRAGCEIVRITAPNNAAAENLKNIRDALRKKNIPVPLVADIHYTPTAALIAAEYVDKVRINPGNYAENRRKQGDYSEIEYQIELEKIEEKFRPLVQKCKQLGVAMRIGVNHGSLSQRIMSRFGDTPEGMVESAMEFIYFAEARGFDQIILSMKASNPQVMIWAYRLLAERMNKENRTYPFHLGVTEAGGGLEGRVKSAAGVYSLLFDGIGDTIRVSLTEDPVNEIPVAKEIVRPFNEGFDAEEIDKIFFRETAVLEEISDTRNPFNWEKMFQDEVFPGLTSEKALTVYELKSPDSEMLEEEISALRNLPEERKPEVIISKIPGGSLTEEYAEKYPEFKFIAEKIIYDHHPSLYAGYLISDSELLLEIPDSYSKEKWIFVKFEPPGDEEQFLSDYLRHLDMTLDTLGDLFSVHKRIALLVNSPLHVGFIRLLNELLKEKEITIPLILSEKERDGDFVVSAAGKYGALLLDGIGDGILLKTEKSPREQMELAYAILQASRLRITRTEYISCPSCGRTLFDLEETTRKIREKTLHLKGVKIGIMGCIVNGPGEMADADFGYVGAGKGKVTLYLGHEPVKKNIPEEQAVEELIKLIKEHGRWVEP